MLSRFSAASSFEPRVTNGCEPISLRRRAHTVYVSYAFYREGWGRVYYDQELIKQGAEAVNRAIGLTANGSLTVDDPNLQMHTAAELKADWNRQWSEAGPISIRSRFFARGSKAVMDWRVRTGDELKIR